MPALPDCIFCKIAAGEIPADVIFQDDRVMAFLDIRPVSKGHTLVIPKNHSASMMEADDDDLASLATHAKRVAHAVMRATGAAGFNLHVNTGAEAGQVVMHTHFHIIPRYSGDGLKLWPHLEIEPKTRAQMAEEIKKFF